MKFVFSKILVLVIGICCLLAFLEVDISNFKQTWHDEYDTYIHVEKQEVSLLQITLKLLNPVLELSQNILFSEYPETHESRSLIAVPHAGPNKIYLRNSVFRI